MQRRKVKNGEKSPWDNVLRDQFQTVAAVLASDCHQSEAKMTATVWNWSGKTLGAIHSAKIKTGPTGKSGPPQNFSGWTVPIH